MIGSPANIKCQLTIDNDTEFHVQNFTSRQVENDFVIAIKDDKELPISNTVYTNASIIINTNVAQFRGTIILKSWSGRSRNLQSNQLGVNYPMCANNIWARHLANKHGAVNYDLQQGRSILSYRLGLFRCIYTTSIKTQVYF